MGLPQTRVRDSFQLSHPLQLRYSFELCVRDSHQLRSSEAQVLWFQQLFVRLALFFFRYSFLLRYSFSLSLIFSEVESSAIGDPSSCLPTWSKLDPPLSCTA
ncbi:hypothetical protein AFLA70_169g002310 [Aspergillus flavus AF70]|nr:hypothetical protein AFLA70_169g002310 [Aspergillus flavus AF70]